MIGIGSSSGTLNLFTPNQQDPVLKVLAHNGNLSHFDFSHDERFFVSVGSDQQMKVFDMRNYYKEMDSYFTPMNSVDLKISQTGLTAVAFRN